MLRLRMAIEPLSNVSRAIAIRVWNEVVLIEGANLFAGVAAMFEVSSVEGNAASTKAQRERIAEFLRHWATAIED